MNWAIVADILLVRHVYLHCFILLFIPSLSDMFYVCQHKQLLGHAPFYTPPVLTRKSCIQMGPTTEAFVSLLLMSPCGNNDMKHGNKVSEAEASDLQLYSGGKVTHHG